MDLKELLGGSAISMRKEDFGRVIGTSPKTYNEIISLAFSKEMSVCWRAADLCLDWLMLESIPVAVKSYSMEILLKITKDYPELKDEFITILEDQMPHNSAGFKARAVQVIAIMEKL